MDTTCVLKYAQKNPTNARKNADTHALFALKAYYGIDMITKMSMIACNSSLGVTTVIDSCFSVPFNVAVDADAIEGDFDVHLWYGTAGGDWSDLPLPRVRPCSIIA